MPLSRDPRGGGSDADGTRSALYCSRCYDRGTFVMPDITVRQMQERVGAKLAQVGVSSTLATRLVRGIPRLRRWRTR